MKTSKRNTSNTDFQKAILSSKRDQTINFDFNFA